MADSMRAGKYLPTALLLALAASPGSAAPATDEGAKAIAQGYAAWFSQAVVDKQLVVVAPQGDDYLVAWDVQKIIDLAKPPPDSLKIDKLSYLLTPAGEDAWKVSAEHFPSIVFNVPTDKGRVSGTIDLSGFHFNSAYDGKAPQFLLSTALAALLSARIHMREAEGASDVNFSQAGFGVEAKAATAGSGIDFSVRQNLTSIAETVTGPVDKGSPAFKMTFTAGQGTSDATFSALRAHEIGDLWKYAIAHASDASPPPDLRDRLGAILPGWNDFHAIAELHDLAMDAEIPLAPLHAELKGLSEVVALSGFTPHAYAEVGLKLTDLSAKMALLPGWAASVQPASLDMDVKVTVDGMAQVARLALDDPNFGGNGDLSPQTQDKIAAILLKGHPRLVIAPGRFATPALEIAYEGEIASEGAAPEGTFTISANGLDKTQALIQEIAKSLPDAQQGLLVLAFVKGLSNTGADGRLVWKVAVGPDGAVTINGTPLPTGK
jgi:hypothetical protein